MLTSLVSVLPSVDEEVHFKSLLGNLDFLAMNVVFLVWICEIQSSVDASYGSILQGNGD